MASIIVGGVCMLNLPAIAAEPVIVNVDNFVRAETAVNFDKTLALLNGEVNKIFHFRQPMSLDGQSVIRSNRDTLYSGAFVDISSAAPASSARLFRHIAFTDVLPLLPVMPISLPVNFVRP